MDFSESVTAVRVVAALAILAYASVLDWRTRKVPNFLWIAMSFFGLILIPIQLSIDKEPIGYALVLAPILAILADVYWNAENKSRFEWLAPAVKYAAAVILVMALGYLWMNQDYFLHLLAVPIFMMFVVLMYMLDIVRGGADAKALLALSILFPFYPVIGSIPILSPDTMAIEIMFPFAFNILVNAAIIVALFPLGFLVKNMALREFEFPYGLFGYKLDLDKARGKHVWMMENMEDGTHRIHMRPRRAEDLDKEISLLLAAGHKRAWITPKIPFIIPITASLVLTTVVGNLLLDLFSL